MLRCSFTTIKSKNPIGINKNNKIQYEKRIIASSSDSPSFFFLPVAFLKPQALASTNRSFTQIPNQILGKLYPLGSWDEDPMLSNLLCKVMCESCFTATTSETFERDEQVDEMADGKIHKRES